MESNDHIIQSGPFKGKRIKFAPVSAEQLAHAFNVHPAIIMFPEYESEEIRKAA
jgi:hypothetical protein